jgi:Icc-related predicted phosphoesterase
MGSIREICAFNAWMEELPHKYKIIVAGNHDELFEVQPSLAKSLLTAPGLIYLQDSGVEIEGRQIWGTPWSPSYNDWNFMKPTMSEGMLAVRDLIPKKLDVLITHAPPRGILSFNKGGEDCGCLSLLYAIEKTQPRVVLCGHIHESYGEAEHRGTRIFNCSVLNERYVATNKPVVFDL